MALELEFLSKLEYLSPKTIGEILYSKNRPTCTAYWIIENQISPVDLFCYLHARFGPPNGIHNFLRANHSDNLIHWNWTLRYGSGLLDIQGMSFRTCVLFIGDFGVEDSDLNKFIAIVKADFRNHGKGMSECRKSLEFWVEFVNPYQRLRRAIDQLVKELASLRPHEITELPPLISSYEHSDQQAVMEQWQDAATRLNKAFGVCFGIRSMLPVMAEAFINLILYILMRKELKADAKVREMAFRENINTRITNLSQNCYGFKKPVDYSDPICRRYNSIVNERNDLLHGNIAISKLRFNEVYFLGTVPVFKEYRSMWNRAFDVQRKAVGLDKVEKEIVIVTDFIEYVLSCLDDQVRINVEQIISRFELGLNKKDDRVGVLFPEYMVDFGFGPDSISSETKE